LSDANKRVIVVNVPMTYPPEPVRGALVSGMPVPANRKDFTYPPQLAQEILEWLPDYGINATSVYIRGKADDFLRDIREKLNQRLTVAERLIERENPDFAMVHILGTDRIQHEFWHCMDETHPEHKGEAVLYKNAILDFYREIDSQLARLLRFVDDDTTVMVISDHGFGALHKFVYLNTWLLEQGYLVLKRSAMTTFKRLAFKFGFSPTNIYRLVSLMGLGGMRGGMDMGRRQQLLDTLFLSFRDVDWSRTQAYARGNFGQIYLNVAGREPEGIIQPGVAYERVSSEIIERLLSTLRDPKTGALLVERAERREALFNGELLHRAPDIAVFMKDETYVALGTADFPASTVASKAIGNTGDHRYNGIFLMHGRGIKPGNLDKASLMDVASTVLHLLDVPVPDDMDGRVILSGLTADLQKIEYAEITGRGVESTQMESDYTPEEEAEILQHLQDLGYL
ncbi:MAG TPA: alkaline phosphatase family protein, partial [Aggregatilineales bacterium]|nr:alkaline phosphatase family protein [Aggregatilineales bacterium]